MMRVILLIFSILFSNQIFAIIDVKGTHKKIAKTCSHCDSDIIAEKRPEKFIKFIADNALGIINKPDITHTQVAAEIQGIVERYFAIENIARFSLGVKYKQLNDKEKSSFLKCFLNMLVRLYSSEFSKYKTAQFAVKGVKIKTPGKHFLVASTISVEKKVIKVDWSVFNVNGRMKVFDVIIDGISLSQIQRADIDGRVGKSGLKGFLDAFVLDYGN